MNTKQPKALAVQPKQEPVNLETIEQYRMQMAGISTAAIGYWKEGDGIHPDYDTVALRDVAKLYAKYDELYKQVHAPQQQREWVGLTEQEVDECWADYYSDSWADYSALARAIEAKLREKNTSPPYPHLKAMQQALDCLEDIFGKNKVDVVAINALREVLGIAE